MPKTLTIPVGNQIVTVTVPDPVVSISSKQIDADTVQNDATWTQADPTYTISGGSTDQTINFQMQDISKGDYARNAAGTNQFYGGDGHQTPTPFQPLDNDQRFNWTLVQTAPNTYNFKVIEDAINKCKSLGQKLSFRIVTCDSGGQAYPSFIGSSIAPDFNSELYLSSFEQMIAALAARLYSTGLIKHVYKIDIGGIGNWSEMHWFSLPAGTPILTAGNVARIIKAYTTNFPDNPLMITISGLTANCSMTIDASYNLLMASNNWGKVGIRTDHLGDPGNFKYDLTDINRQYNGVDFKTEIINRWKTSPIAGELMNDLSKINSSNPYSDLNNEAMGWHLSQFSNNNWCRNTASKASASQISMSDNNILAASKICGPRIGIESASISAGKLILNWNNSGYGLVYENYIVQLLIDGVLSNSTANMRAIVPGKYVSTDQLPASFKTISIIITDPAGIRKPYSLLNTGRLADGSYKVT